MEIDPFVKATLAIEGDFFDLDALSRLLDIVPTWASRKEDAPKCAIRGPCWSVDTGKAQCWSIHEQFAKLAGMLAGKEQQIVDFCKENEAEAFIVISIYGIRERHPEISLPIEDTLLLVKLNAEFNIGLYLDEIPEDCDLFAPKDLV